MKYSIAAVMVTNMFGIVNLIGSMISNRYWLRGRSREAVYLYVMMLLSLVSCVADPVSYYFDGRQGANVRAVIMICNTWMYLSYVLLAVLGIQFTLEHIRVKMTRRSNIAGFFLLVCGIDLLIINCYVPIVFEVSDANVFARKSIAGIYFGVLFFAGVLGMVIYMQHRRKQDYMDFFPVGLIGIPLLIGTLIQYMFYGLSVLYAFETISLGIIMSCIRNERLYQDHMTGMYNASFLPYLWSARRYGSAQIYSCVVVQIREIPQMEEKFGTEFADRAVMRMAEVIRRSVRAHSCIVHYDRTTFLILARTGDERLAQLYQYGIQEQVDRENADNCRMYELKADVWYRICNIRECSAAQLMKELAAAKQGDRN